MSRRAPRTRANFPRMKDRSVGRRNRIDRQLRAQRWSLFRRGIAQATTAAAAAGKKLNEIGAAADRAAARLGAAAAAATERILVAFHIALWLTVQNNRNRWIATHQITTGPGIRGALATTATPCTICRDFGYSRSCRHCGGSYLEPSA